MKSFITLLIVIGNLFLSNYVVTEGWNGILVPLFDIRTLTYWQMMAVSFVYTAFKGIPVKAQKDQPNEDESLAIAVVQTIVICICWISIIIGKKII